jgi:RNA polymerase sigma-70 factor (ECF subfamily)
MAANTAVVEDWKEPVAGEARDSIFGLMDSPDDDAKLMRRYASGDLAAFAVLYERHKGPLFRYLLRQARSREVAEDLFQEVWSRIVSSRARYVPLARFSTFLFSIGHNCFIDHCRRKANIPTSQADSLENHDERLADSSHLGPERQTASQQLGERLRAALSRLPDEQREVFVLYEESGLSLHEIAAITGVGMETAKSRLRYALAKLRQSLADEGNAPLARAPLVGAENETR